MTSLQNKKEPTHGGDECLTRVTSVRVSVCPRVCAWTLTSVPRSDVATSCTHSNAEWRHTSCCRNDLKSSMIDSALAFNCSKIMPMTGLLIGRNGAFTCVPVYASAARWMTCAQMSS